MASTEKEKAAQASGYQPSPECNRGHSLWEGACEKCSECGREFDGNGLLVAYGRSEGDLDDWGSLN